MTDLNPADYVPAFDLLAKAATALEVLATTVGIRRMRQICAQMQALAPVLEPNAYQRGGMDELRDQAAFLAALDTFVTDLRKLDRRTTEETDRG